MVAGSAAMSAFDSGTEMSASLDGEERCSSKLFIAARKSSSAMVPVGCPLSSASLTAVPVEC